MTSGLESVANELPFSYMVNGVALVTGWLSGGPWIACTDNVSTAWQACFVAPTTGWTACFTQPATAWTAIA